MRFPWDKELNEKTIKVLDFIQEVVQMNNGSLLEKLKEKVPQYVNIVELQKMLNFIQMDGIQLCVNLVKIKKKKKNKLKWKESIKKIGWIPM